MTEMFSTHRLHLGSELFVLDVINNHVAGVHGARIYKIVIPEFDHEKPPAPVCSGKKITNKKSKL